jgi:simple sugar transport system permease protein
MIWNPVRSDGSWARRTGLALGRQAALLAVAALALAGLLAATGFAVGPALSALWRGAAGSPDAVLSATLVRATPLLLAGLGVAVAFRAGVFNIGADGQLLAGATAATIVGLAMPGAGLVAAFVALAVAALAGSAWAGGPAWLRRRFGTLEVISTIMFNFLALHLVSYLVRGPLQEPTRVYPQSPALSDGVRLPVVIEGSRLHAGFVVAVLLAVAAALALRHSAAGFRLRAVGANPSAAASAGGIDVASVQTRALLASGALAGLAGGSEILGVTFALYENLSPGYGYTAIAVALLADLRPLTVIWTSALLGALAAGAAAMQRDAGVPAGAAAVAEAVLVLALLAGQAVAGRPSWRFARLTMSANRVTGARQA